MALNIQTFRTRALTALIFVIVMLLGLFINAWSFIGLFMVIMIGCLFEYVKIIKKINGKRYLIYLPLAAIYIVMPLLMMIDLGITINIHTAGPAIETITYSPLLPCAIIFSIWINDTMAYLVGSFIGKTPFSKISPKKTWEGTIGGALLCVVVIVLAGHYIPVAKIIGWKYWLVIAAICAVFGTAGDLLESKLKRMADIKDSGNFMPGHGGFLDRFDSLLVATPFVWLYIHLLL
ncbi:MAG: phosphatidate cytidylyltransferase [Ferruginibacter sp.]